MRGLMVLALCALANVAMAQDPACAIQDATSAVYPPIAKAAHVEGDVLFLAAFDHDGKATSLRLVSGPPLLQEASWASVKTWQAKPYAGSRTCLLAIHYRIEDYDPPRQPYPSQSGPGHMTVVAMSPALYSMSDPRSKIIRRKRFGIF